VTKLTVEQQHAGYHLGRHACQALKPGHRRPKHAKACTITKTIESFTHQDTAGSNRIPFTGRVRGHALAAGAYLLTATPKRGSLTGTTISAGFHIT
jgi:hypothetical protein